MIVYLKIEWVAALKRLQVTNSTGLIINLTPRLVGKGTHTYWPFGACGPFISWKDKWPVSSEEFH